jgi:homocysteine S-methyltransferase
VVRPGAPRAAGPAETLPSSPELDALLELLDEVPGPPAWIAFSCRDEARIGDGTPFAEVAARAASHVRVVGVGVNCTPPHLVAPLLRTLPRLPRDTHLVVYPNIGDAWDVGRQRWVRPREPVDPGPWRRLGADAVGGCCGTSPQDVRRLASTL